MRGLTFPGLLWALPYSVVTTPLIQLGFADNTESLSTQSPRRTAVELRNAVRQQLRVKIDQPTQSENSQFYARQHPGIEARKPGTQHRLGLNTVWMLCPTTVRHGGCTRMDLGSLAWIRSGLARVARRLLTLLRCG